MSLADVGNLSLAAAAILALIGILVTAALAIRTAKELDHDRRLRYSPYLAFQPGGYPQLVQFVRAGRRIPGIDPAYVERVFGDLPDDAESVRIASNYGVLRNYGVGPALDVQVTWCAEMVKIGKETFQLDDRKREEPIYRPALNSMPSVPGHILPGDQAELSRLPTFIEKDIDRKLTEVDGYLTSIRE